MIHAEDMADYLVRAITEQVQEETENMHFWTVSAMNTVWHQQHFCELDAV